MGNLPLLPPAPPMGNLPLESAAPPAKMTSKLPIVGGLPGVTFTHVKEAFDQIDFDGNGFIGVNELRYLLTAMGERPKDEELDEMLRLFDDDGNGQIDYDEFQALFLPGTPVLPEMMAMAPDDQMGGSPRHR